MRNLVRNSILVLLVLAFFVWQIYPPSKKLRLGKDLAGGVSLIYAVNVGSDSPSEVIPRVIEVLQERVNPYGTQQITMVPQGRDRIEITMPMPTPEVERLRAAYEDALSLLQSEELTEGQLDRLMALEPEARGERLAGIAAGNELRATRVQDLIKAHDEYQRALGAYNEIAGRFEPARQAIEAAEAAEREYRAARQAAERTGVSAEDVDRLLALQGEERATLVAELAGEAEPKAQRLAELVEAYDKSQAARAEADRLLGQGPSQDEYDKAVGEAGAALTQYETARDAVLATSLSAERVREALNRSNEPRRKWDNKTKKTVVLPSPRALAVDRLKEDYPEFTGRIDEIVAAHDRYLAARKGLDDPSDLIRLLKGAGVLNFRITVDSMGGPYQKVHQEEPRLREDLHRVGPANVQSTDTGWYKINRIENWADTYQAFEAMMADPVSYFRNRGYVVEEYDGEYYMLCWDVRGSRLTQAEGDWQVAGAGQGVDQLGRPAINFTMDARGAQLLGELTGPHVQDRMAILLDDQIYTAPVLNSRISQRGQITGDFGVEELRYIVRLLSAGSLRARLSEEPISQSTLGPELGRDRLRDGFTAAKWALVGVSAFMLIYYFICGGIAVVALLCNAVLILGAMAISRASFTLPGIAGVILTFGMAVDANVLIFERMREELRKGADIRAAVRLGYQKALSAIVDGNVTNLIVCFVLFYTGTTEIKGFAVTLGIGVVCTLFSALVISRLIFAMLLERGNLRRLTMLPTKIPAIERALEPRINWLRLRWIFVVISSGYVLLGLAMVRFQAPEMLDTEFVGGTDVTLNFGKEGQRITATREEVQQLVEEVAASDPRLAELGRGKAVVVPIDPEADGVTSHQFRIKTKIQDTELVLDELVRRFNEAGLLAEMPPLEFAAQDLPFDQAPVYPVLHDALGEVIQRPSFRASVADYRGGVAIVLDGIAPPPSKAELAERLQHMRRQQDYSDTLTRRWEVMILEGTEQDIRSAVLLVADENINYYDNQDRWESDLARREWQLTVEALQRATTPASVQSFSSTVAETFKARAVVAVFLSFLLIMIYIWVRFGSFRYSAAAIVCLLHDVLTVIGLIALAEIAYHHTTTEKIAQSLLILPFRIDLNMVAAVLTIIGYSLNDTIVVMDRIRENRGKLDYATGKVINTSINETISRTVITSGTTLLAVFILYTAGGEGVRSFSFALMIGVVIGTYSSIAVAAPLVWSRRKTPGGTVDARSEPAV